MPLVAARVGPNLGPNLNPLPSIGELLNAIVNGLFGLRQLDAGRLAARALRLARGPAHGDLPHLARAAAARAHRDGGPDVLRVVWRRARGPARRFWLEATDALASVSPPNQAPERARLEPRPARALADVILSFSELKYAFECPYSFKLRFLYGFNPPIAEALGFGKGLHDALFEMHDRVLHGEAIDQDCVPGLVDRHVFLPFAYPDLRETLSAAASRRLEAYVAERGATFADIEHAERPIEIDLGDGIRVNGRIDLIRRRSTNEIVVIDFKSNDRTQQEEVTDLQLRVYALGYEQATGERASEVVVDNLDDLAHPRSSVVDEAMLTEAVAAVREVGGRLRGNAYPRAPRGATLGECDAVCARCDLVGICGGHADCG